MIYVHLSITIAVLALTLYLFSKASQNNPGTLLKWIWYIAIVAAFSIMVCQLATGLGSMFGGGKDCHAGGKDCYRKGKHGMMHKGMGDCCGMKSCRKGGKGCMRSHCDMSMKGHHKMMMMDCEGMEVEEETEIDSTADGQKIIKKKIIITTDDDDDDDDDDGEDD
jgi:hypothetical protein